jgi:hypothetical protein
MEQFNTLVNDRLGWIHEHKYVLPCIIAFLGMYGALARPKIPSYIEKLFQNSIFRMVVISYVIYRGNSDPQLSLTIVAVFLLVMHTINKNNIEGMAAKTKNKNKT